MCPNRNSGRYHVRIIGMFMFALISLLFHHSIFKVDLKLLWVAFDVWVKLLYYSLTNTYISLVLFSFSA